MSGAHAAPEPQLGTLFASLSTATLWVTVAVAAAQASTLASNVLVANILGPERFGLYGFVQTTQNTFALIAQLSLGLAATRFIPEWRLSDPARAGEFLANATIFVALFGLLLASVLVGSALVADLEWGAPLPRSVFAAVLITVPLLGLGLLQNGVFVGFEWFRSYASFSFGAALVGVALPAVGALVGGLAGAVWGLSLAVLVRVGTGAVTAVAKLRGTDVRLSLKRTGVLARVAREFAFPSSLGAVIGVGAPWLCSLLLMKSTGALEFGLFVASFAARQLVVFIPAQLSGVALTLMSRRSAAASRQRVFRLSVALTIAVAALVTGLAGVFSEQLLSLFGSDFTAGEALLQVMLAGAFVESIGMSIYQLLPYRSRMWSSVAYVTIPRDGSLLVLAWLVVPLYGAIGLALCILASQLIGLGGTALAVRSRDD